MKSPTRLPDQASQRGIVSIMVTMVLMMVITLIVLGFAQLSRREQRQSLDRQLSTQAFLAAESGVNDARSAILEAIENNRPIEEKTDCETTPANPGTNPYPFNPVIDADSNVRYTCLLVSTGITDIRQTVAANGKGVRVPLQPASGTISSIRINWTLGTPPADISSCANSAGALPKAGSGGWACPYGLLRMDIAPSDPAVMNRAALMANQKAAFLYPTRAPGAASLAYGSAKGAVSRMVCTAAGGCSIDITGLGGFTNYDLRFSAVYASGNLQVTALDVSGNPVMLRNAQVLVDSTGRAQDVLRRIQVRFSLQPGGGVTMGEYALQSASPLCKRFEVITTTNTFSVPGDIAGQSDKAHNPLCRPI